MAGRLSPVILSVRRAAPDVGTSSKASTARPLLIRIAAAKNPPEVPEGLPSSRLQ